MAQRPPLFALLVGINEHDPESGVPALRGGVNDARTMAHLLRHDFGVPADDIVTLVDAAATGAGIEAAVLHHLLARGKRWCVTHAQQVKQGDSPSFLLHFSGYGVQARTETGAPENALVVWDSYSPGGELLRASELRTWVQRLEEAGSVTVILDCSTAPPAAADETLGAVRVLPPDTRLPSTLQGHALQISSFNGSATGWDLGAATVICACRSGETAREHAHYATGQGEVNTPQWYGSLTWSLRERLLALPIGATISIQALGKALLGKVNLHNGDQHPAIAGALDKSFLGGIRRTGDGALSVLGEWEGLWWVEGGSAHGLGVGAELRLAPGEKSAVDASQCTLRVVRSEADRSACRIVEVGARLAEGARLEVVRPPLPDFRSGVRILLASPRERYRLAALIDGPIASADSRAWLESVAAGEDMRVVQAETGVAITDRGGAVLAEELSLHDMEQVAAKLLDLARQRWLWGLRNETPFVRAAAMECTLRQVDATRGGATVAIPAPSGEGIVLEGTPLVLDVVNRSAEALHVAVIAFGRGGSYRVVHPAGVAHAPLLAGERMSLPLRAEFEAASRGYETGVEEQRFKVVATCEPVDWHAIEAGDLQAFGALANVVSGRPTTTNRERACWATEELRISVVEAAQVVVVDGVAEALRQVGAATQTIRALGRGVSIETPPRFRGSARLLTARQSQLLRGIETIALPPGLVPYPELFAPATVGAPGKRAALAMIELECDDVARKSVTSESPLIMHVPQQQGVALFALAETGGAWYPVGRTRLEPGAPSASVAVEWLPAAQAARVRDEADDAALGIMRVMRLFLFRVLDEPVASLGLYNVRYVPAGWAASASRASFVRRVAGGELRYTAATPLRADERVALLVHGVGSDSAEQALWVSTTLRRMGVEYDRVLAFEYEGVGTPVHENALALAKALKQLGAASIEGVALDFYAHSMGGIIVRDLVERLGGDRYVRNAILAASPNLGTPLADAALLAPWLIALGINLPLPTPSGILIAWALGSLAAEAQGIADVTRRSPLLDTLNNSERRVLVRYHLLAGDVGAQDDEVPDALSASTLLSVLAEGLNRGAGWYFEGENDLVVAVKSSTGLHVNQAAGSHVLTRILRCNHFGYFESESVAVQVARWLLGTEGGGEKSGEESEQNLWYDFIAPRSAAHAGNGLNGETAHEKRVVTFRQKVKRA